MCIRDREHSPHHDGRPLDAHLEILRVQIIQSQGGSQDHHEHQHIVPAGVVAAVEGVKGAVENGDEGHKIQHQQGAGQPAFLVAAGKSDDPRHGKEGEEGTQ